MTNLKQDFGGRLRMTNDWRADVPYQTKPLVIKTKMISGVKYYQTADKKLILSSVFNKIWGEPKIA